MARKIADDQLDKWFEYWFKHDCNSSAVARRFKVAPCTVWRYVKRLNWNERADKRRTEIRKGMDRKAVSSEISNLELARKCLAKEAKAYLSKKYKAGGNVAFILGLMRYIDEVQGNMPTADGNGSGINIVNVYESIKPESAETQDRNIAAILNSHEQGSRPRNRLLESL
jgi:hypothetical protein